MLITKAHTPVLSCCACPLHWQSSRYAVHAQISAVKESNRVRAEQLEAASKQVEVFKALLLLVGYQSDSTQLHSSSVAAARCQANGAAGACDARCNAV